MQEFHLGVAINQEGQTACFGPCFHLPGQPILEFRFFEPQPFELQGRVFGFRSSPEEALTVELACPGFLGPIFGGSLGRLQKKKNHKG